MTGQTHEIRGPIVAFGIAALPPRPDRTDRFCRDQLVEHASALCRTTHGHGDPSTCIACRRLTRET